jgi:uncharacterized protein (DUF302 family)
MTKALKACFTLGAVLLTLSTTASAQSPPPDFLVTKPSSYSFSDTVDLLKGAIEEQNLMVIHEVDAQRMLRMVGREVGGMKQIMFFHPRYMNRIMDLNRNGSIVPPLKIVVMERPDGKVMVRYPKPSALFSAYDGLEEMGGELDALVATIVTEASDS